MKQEILEIIKWSHIKCCILDTEHLFLLPKTWLEYQQYEDVHMAITQNLYNAYYMPKYFVVEKYFETWDPRSWNISQHKNILAYRRHYINLY